MQLEDFNGYKNQLMKDLLTTQSIVELIKDDADVSEAADLAYTQVFPYEYIPEAAQPAQTFICFDTDIQKPLSKTILALTLNIWVFSHKSRLRLPDNSVRTDKLCAEICKKINGSFKYGLGALELESVKRIAPAAEYQGKVLTFNAKEFKRILNSDKKLPGNRKE